MAEVKTYNLEGLTTTEVAVLLKLVQRGMDESSLNTDPPGSPEQLLSIIQLLIGGLIMHKLPDITVERLDINERVVAMRDDMIHLTSFAATVSNSAHEATTALTETLDTLIETYNKRRRTRNN